jgi:DNA repair protein RadC
MSAHLKLVPAGPPDAAASEQVAQTQRFVTRMLDWPERDRPRERLLRMGADSLSDAELLALFLGSGRPGMSAVDIARDLLGRFESVRGVLSASEAQLCTFDGEAALLLATSELCRRLLAEKTRARPLLDTPHAVEDYLSC